MKNILLFRLGGLGDLLVTFPSIYLLRRKLSPCSISLVCRKEYGMILKETGIVDELISVDDRRLVPLFVEHLSGGEELVQWFRKFNLLIGWMQTEKALNLKQSWLASFGKTIRLFVYDTHSQEEISKFFFRKTSEFLKKEEKLSLPFSECIHLPLSLDQKKEGLKLLGEKALCDGKKIVVIHPGSGGREKCWPFPNFLTIIRRLNQQDVKGVLVSGMAEEWIENEIRDAKLPENWVRLQNPLLVKLTGLLYEASFYLGNDSGITHLAAACGAKGIALFRKDLETAWRPYGRMAVLSGHSLAEIDVETVWKTLAG